MDGEEVAERFRLTADEDLILTAWQYRMMQRDIAASGGKRAIDKRAVRDQFRTDALGAVQERDRGSYSQPSVAATANSIAEAVTGGDSATALEALEEAGPALSTAISLRSRSLLLLIDLYGFEPWPTGRWDRAVREAALAEACAELPRLRAEDLTGVGTAYGEVTKRLVVKSRSWRKLALVGAAGLGLGALTAGLAAPAIAGLYGTVVLGYSGAVATSAGMAALGGGSLAAGGFGMAGGAAFITGAGGAAAAGAASVGAHATGFTAAQVAADVIRLQVAARLVLLDAEGNDEAAKAVVVAMRERVATLARQFAELARKAEHLRGERDEARAELNRERAARMAAEGRLRRLQVDMTDRLRDKVSGPDNDALRALNEHLQEVEQAQKATGLVIDFVRAGADDLEKHAA